MKVYRCRACGKLIDEDKVVHDSGALHRRSLLYHNRVDFNPENKGTVTKMCGPLIDVTTSEDCTDKQKAPEVKVGMGCEETGVPVKRDNLPSEIDNFTARLPLISTTVSEWPDLGAAKNAVQEKIRECENSGWMLKSVHIQPEWMPDKIVAVMVDFSSTQWNAEREEMASAGLRKENEKLKKRVQELRTANENCERTLQAMCQQNRSQTEELRNLRIKVGKREQEIEKLLQ